MRSPRRAERGFSLVELMLTIAFAATVLTIAVPVMTDVSDSSKLNGAAREIEREFQSARLKSVSTNRLLRVRLNCPGTGMYRTVEYVASAAVDAATNRCSDSAYPFPPADTCASSGRRSSGWLVFGCSGYSTRFPGWGRSARPLSFRRKNDAPLRCASA